MSAFGIILILVGVGCGIVLVLLKKGLSLRLFRGQTDQNPYERARVLFSSTHAAFFDLLEKALDDRYRVIGNVRLTDVVDVRDGLSRKQRSSALKRLPPTRIDFIICEKQDTFILGAVMIDEDFHESGAVRPQGEAALDKFMVAVGIPVARLSRRRNYTIEDIRVELSRTLYLKWKDSPQSSVVEHAGNLSKKNGAAYGNCPACGMPFVKRRARKGTYAGKFFLICSNYPACKHVRLIKDNSVLLKAQN